MTTKANAKKKTSRKATGARTRPSAAPNGRKAPQRPATPDPALTAETHAREAGAPTVAELADAYLEHLEKISKSVSTVFSYRMDLKIAQDHFGEETPATSLTQDLVAEFFESEAVTKRKNGKPKTEVTIKKTRRVLRMALVWAAEAGLIAEAPIPAATASKKA